MPVYEYVCLNKFCPIYNKVQEVIKPITDSGTKERCIAQCKGSMKKLMSKNTFVLKGGGWYER